MPELIVFIESCEAYRHDGTNAAARETWLSKWGGTVPYRFILGRGCENPLPDELVLDVGDGYKSLSHKIKAARRWATENGYRYSFQAGADTYICVPRLLSCGFEKHQYLGYLIHDEHRLYAPRNIQFAQGGGGYFLGPDAGDLIINTEIPDWLSWADDVFVGDTLFKAGVPFGHDAGFWCWGYRGVHDPPTLEGGHFIGMDAIITEHLSRWWGAPKYSTGWMHDTHNRFLKVQGEPWRRLVTPAPPPDVP